MFYFANIPVANKPSESIQVALTKFIEKHGLAPDDCVSLGAFHNIFYPNVPLNLDSMRDFVAHAKKALGALITEKCETLPNEYNAGFARAQKECMHLHEIEKLLVE